MTIEGTAMQGALIVDSICKNYCYTAGTETGAEFARKKILQFITDNVRQYRIAEADAVKTQKIAEAEAEVTLLAVK